MHIAVTGSIAIEYHMIHPGAFAEHLTADKLDRVSLSFLVDKLEVMYGGAAANICYGLGQLALRPVLVGAVGRDFGDYRSWLERHGVDTKSVHVSPSRHTARFLHTTDDYQNQITAFYPGAISEARKIELSPIAKRIGGLDLVLVAQNDPGAMLHYTDECRTRGYPFVVDLPQQMAWITRDEIRLLVVNAAILFTNEDERDVMLSKVKWSYQSVLDRVGVWVTTLGEKGARIESAAGVSLVVPAVPQKTRVDSTGAGDAFRAGFIGGLACDLSLERSAQLGCMLATIVLDTRGTQGYKLDWSELRDRLGDAYGRNAAADITSRISCNLVGSS